MDQETTGVQDAPQEAKGQTEAGGAEGGTNEMPSDNQLAYETYKRAVAQRAKFKEEAERAKAEAEALKQQVLEQEGKKDEALAYWKNKATELEQSYKTDKQNYIWNVVGGQLKAELAAHGCVNPDKAIKLIDKAELKSIEVDDQYRVSSEDLKRIVESVKTENADIGLFRRHGGVKDIVPTNVEYTGNENKDISQLSDEELKKVWMNLNK
jgi:hypothetical protein